MLFTRSYAPRGTDRSVKVVKTARPGVERFSRREYGGYFVELWRRRLGMSVRRVSYSVSITAADGARSAYLADFANADQALQAAQTWIDRAPESRSPWNDRAWRQTRSSVHTAPVK